MNQKNLSNQQKKILKTPNNQQEILLDRDLQEMLEIVNRRTVEDKIEILKKIGFTKVTQPKPWHGIKMTTPLT